MKLAVTLCCFILTLAAFAQSRIPVKTAEKLHLTNNIVSNITQSMMGQEMEISSDVTIHMNTEIKETAPDIHLSSIITRIQLKNQAMGQSQDFDSDKKEDMNGQLGQVFKDLVGKSKDAFVSTDGKLVNKPSDNKGTPSAVEAMMGDNLDALSLELLLALPGALKAGDKWTDETNTDADNRKKLNYTVQSVNGNEAILTFTGEETSKKQKSIQGMNATVTASSNYTGELTVDTLSGIIKEKKTTAQSKGETAIMGQTIPFKLQQTVKSSSR